ncbi:MAG: hypothetical protein ABFD45_11495 [Smithella sp.]
MFNTLNILERIMLDPPTAKIYSRLGFKKNSTSLSASQRQETDRHIQEAVSLIDLQGSFLILPIRKNDGQKVELHPDLSFVSEKLGRFLGHCREAALMGATAGPSIMEAIREKTKQDKMTAVVVYDATASEMADAALDWIMDYINRQLLREGKHLLPRRFSAGYGDLALSSQIEIHKKLQLERIGVRLTGRCLLVPEKSVTAISGIL